MASSFFVFFFCFQFQARLVFCASDRSSFSALYFFFLDAEPSNLRPSRRYSHIAAGVRANRLLHLEMLS